MNVEEWLVPKLPIILCGKPAARSQNELDALAWTIAKSMGILEFHIVPDSKVLITKEGLEAAAEMICRIECEQTGNLLAEEFQAYHEHYVGAARRIIESLNITVVDEVWHQRHSNCLLTSLVEPEEPKWQQTDIEPGDILYIKRKED